MATVWERHFGGITVYMDDQDVAKTPEEQRRVDEEVSRVLYDDIFANPANVEQLRQYNREHYGIEN